MSLQTYKKIIENYDPSTISAEEIDGLTAMLQCESFLPLYDIIVDKIKECKKFLEKTKKEEEKKDQKSPENSINTNRPVETFIVTFTLDPIIFNSEPSKD